MGSVNQTSLVFGALLFAFLFFITVRGELAQWLGIFGLAKPTGLSPTGSGPAASGNIPAPGVIPQNWLNPQTGLLPSSGVPSNFATAPASQLMGIGGPDVNAAPASQLMGIGGPDVNAAPASQLMGIGGS